MSQEITGPQMLLIEIIKLQMKMGESLAVTNGRIAVLETTLRHAKMPEGIEEHFSEVLKSSQAEHESLSIQLREQLKSVVDALERYMHG